MSSPPPIIFTSPIISHPPAGGPELRIENSIKALSRIARVHLAHRNHSTTFGGPSARGYYSTICESVHEVPSAKLYPGRRSIPRRVLLAAARSDARFLIRLADEHGAKIIWCGYGNISSLLLFSLKSLRPDLLLVCDTDSVWSRFVMRELPFEKRPLRKLAIYSRAKLKEREEQWWADHCDVTLAVSELDAVYYRSLTPHPERVKVFSNVIDVDTYANAGPAPFTGMYGLVSGSFYRHGPMDDGVHWLMRDVMPSIWRRHPDFTLVVAGRGSRELLTGVTDPRIHVVGSAPSLVPWLANAAVSIVPLRFESGTRFKILEAGACGVPVVSTTLGAEGLPLEDGVHLLLADGSDAMARAVSTVLDDGAGARERALRCRSVVESQFGLTALAAQGRDVFAFLAEASAAQVLARGPRGRTLQ